MTDDERDTVEAALAAALDDGAFDTFAGVAGGIIKRDLLERGLGELDPAALDPEVAGRVLLSAWAEAAAQCFPDRPPAEVVDLLASLTDQHAQAREETAAPGHRLH